MKRTLIFLLIFCIVAAVVPAQAQDGRVTYSGNAGEFIFEPGSEHSVTDLFPNFKGVMPGDSLTQKITVKNDADDKVKVKIYIRSLGAHEESVEFLSQLGLKVSTSQENQMAYMFDAAADQTAQLTDWVCLGTLYSGGEVNLDVTLSVPVEMGNEFQDQIGYLDWEFKVEEYPAQPDDPKPPQTGDNTEIIFYLLIAVVAILILFIIWKRRKKDDLGRSEEGRTKRGNR